MFDESFLKQHVFTRVLQCMTNTNEQTRPEPEPKPSLNCDLIYNRMTLQHLHTKVNNTGVSHLNTAHARTILKMGKRSRQSSTVTMTSWNRKKKFFADEFPEHLEI